MIQARETSSRLPNKIYLPFFGLPGLEFLYRRLCCLQDCLVVFAVPDSKSNVCLRMFLESRKIPYYPGPENDVFERFGVVINAIRPKYVVRVNADCPFLSPAHVDDLRRFFLSSHADYASTTLNDSFPLGEHVEIFSTDAFMRASEMERTPLISEHVTPAFYCRKEFVSAPMTSPHSLEGLERLRLCIDYREDHLFLRSLESLLPGAQFSYADLLAVARSAPDLLEINSEYVKPRVVSI